MHTHATRPAWWRTLASLWYLPVVHLLLPACVPVRQVARPPAVARGAGVAVLFGGAALTTASLTTLVAAGDGTPAPWDPPVRLVQRGPYRFCRNPMELGNLLMLVGRAMIGGELRAVLAVVVFAALHQLWFVQFEEPDLRQRFGADYLDYSARVPRWLPGCSRATLGILPDS